MNPNLREIFMRNMMLCCLLLMASLVSCNNEPDLPAVDNILRIYPNPVKDQAHINIENAAGEPYKLLVFDTEGELLLEQDGNDHAPMYRVSLYDKPEGNYQVVLRIGIKDYSQNIIKLK